MASRPMFFLIYGISGLAALIYEVVWTRLLTLHMGHTVAAASTVLAAFMGGLAVGAGVAGRRASRVRRADALRLYALLEVAIAISGICIPIVLGALGPLLAWSYANGEGGAWFGLTRFLTSLLLLGVPAAAMGATFPVAARWTVGRVDLAGREAGGLYAANTIGATLGSAIGAFALIPWLGIWGATLVAAALNGIAAAGALALAKREAPADPAAAPAATVLNPQSAVNPKSAIRNPKSKGSPARLAERERAQQSARGGAVPASTKKDGGARPSGRPWLAACALAISGFVALAYEVAWTRIFASAIGPTTYAFGAMLTAFIGGLAGGSLVAASLASRTRQPAFWLGLTLVANAIGALAALSAVGRLPLTIARLVSDPGARFESIVLLQSGIIAGLLLPTTLALGAAFPFAIASAARRADAISLDVGLVYAFNTAGAIAGALAGGFILIPLLGLQGTVLAAGSLAIAGGLAVILVGSPGTRTAVAGLLASAAGVAAVLLFPSWDRELLASGAYKYAPYVREPDLESALKAGTLLYYQEGAAATVSVKRVAGSTSLAIDGKVDASNSGDMLTQKLLAHLPLMLHPNPREICIVGLGSGVTLGAALRHPIRRADTLEISPEVVEAASFFSAENHEALDDPRSRLILGDGRTHLLLADRTYDVIVSEPSNPWMAGVAALFTREFFEAARARLAPDGILCQWAHTYDISDADLRSIVATFATVFPRGTMWLVGDGDLLLVGSTEPLERAIDRLEGAWSRPGVAADLAEVGVEGPESLASLFAAGEAGLNRYAGGATIQTDSRMALEFSAPRGIYGRSRGDNAAAIRSASSDAELPSIVASARRSTDASLWRSRGRMLLQAEAYGPAFEAFARATTLDPHDEEALSGLARASAGVGRRDEAVGLLTRLAAQRPGSVAVEIALSRLLASQGALDRALDAARRAMAAAPSDPRGREQLASILADMGDPRQLQPLVVEMQRHSPDREATLYYAASARFLEGGYLEAIQIAERAVNAHPQSARAQNILGAAHASLGDRDQARRAFQASLRADPGDSATYTNLGLLELQSANPAAAADYFAEALTIDPTSDAALNGLSEALGRLGESDRAARISASRR